MSTMGTPKMQAPDAKALVPKCPHCKQPVQGLNISGLILPMPDGRKLNFLMPCCPNIDCSVILAVQLIPGEHAADAGAPPPDGGLWTPPGGRH